MSEERAPSGERGRRFVALVEDAMGALRRHRARQNADKLKLGPDYTDLGLVFASAVGTVMIERNAMREFKEALEHAGSKDSRRRTVRASDFTIFDPSTSPKPRTLA